VGSQPPFGVCAGYGERQPAVIGSEAMSRELLTANSSRGIG